LRVYDARPGREGPRQQTMQRGGIDLSELNVILVNLHAVSTVFRNVPERQVQQNRFAPHETFP